MDFYQFLAVAFTTILLVLFFYLIGLIIVQGFNCIRDITRVYIEDYTSDTESVELQPDVQTDTASISIL
jgi:hypothetical protein